MNSFSPRTILVVKNRAMGDSIMGLSSLQWLKKTYPDSRIVYGLPSWIIPLYENVTIAADQIINVDLKSTSDWFRLYKEVRSINPDYIHEMHLSGRTSKFFSLYSKIHNSKYSFHNHHLNSKTDVLDQGVIKPLIQRDLDGVWSFLGKNTDIPSFESLEPKMTLESVEDKNQIIFGVVATRETKMWPLEYYVELSKRIESKILIPLSKSEEDLKIKKQLIDLGISSRAEFLHSPLADLPEKLSGSKYYIGNDTGLKHLSIAVGVPTLTFFGPEPPLEWHPYASNSHNYLYIDQLECRTREFHYCGLSQCDSMICLNQISVDQVMEKLNEI
ncbi:MAG: glycosyltransferase family 9 protein [Bacteriovoracaceae bacterium]|nr:glycosyltransferase family 9 protein [Bacteriovoracaceae bacterium]